MTLRENFGDNAGEIAGARNREIQLRLSAYHDAHYGGSQKPDASKYVNGKRAKIDNRGVFTNRYTAAPGVADDAKNVAEQDFLHWLAWQEPQSGGYYERATGDLI